MSHIIKGILVFTLATALSSGAALAQHHGHGGGHWHGGGHGGAWGGFAAGAILGGLLAAPYYNAPYYYPGPGYAYEPVPSDAVAYCLQRFRSYDPATGTYVGYDGRRHPCP
jgi:hypothetical protein